MSITYPKFYDQKRIGTLFHPRINDEVFAEAVEFKKANKVQASVNDKIKIALLIIDAQIDFCHPGRPLYVKGAEGDVSRIIDFIFKNIDKITTIFPSLDTHLVFQIFLRTWWAQANGNFVDPFTLILPETIDKGDAIPLNDPIGSIDYVKQLIADGSDPLCIWPYHTPVGAPGHALDPALYEAIFYHSVVRSSQPSVLTKGTLAKSEMYGILCPEVKLPKQKGGGFNTDFLKLIMNHDRVYAVGEAKSHCFKQTLKQIVDFFAGDPEVLKKIYILEDCTSSVQHPAVDFEAIAQKAFDKFRKSGVNIVKSVDVIL